MFDSPSRELLPHARCLQQLLPLLKQRQGQASAPLLELVDYTLIELRFSSTSEYYFDGHPDRVLKQARASGRDESRGGES